MWEEVEGLKDHPHIPPYRIDVANIVAKLNAVHHYLASLVLFQTVYGANEGGLPRPGRAEHHYNLGPGYAGCDASQGMEVAIPFVNIPADNDIFRTSIRFMRFHVSPYLGYRLPTPRLSSIFRLTYDMLYVNTQKTKPRNRNSSLVLARYSGFP